MPELPDIVTYIHALEPRIVGQPIEDVLIRSPFLVRTYDPPVESIRGLRVNSLRRVGKRIVWSLDDDLHVVLHLMIAGRLRWREPGAKLPARVGLASFSFPEGVLVLTEASKKRRASLHVVRGESGVTALDPGGLEVAEASLDEFREAILRENHTLKRVLTDPRVLSGVGNAFSDEILHRAGLSPLRWSQRLDEAQLEGLFRATQAVLEEWTRVLLEEVGDGFPEKVTAFRKGMAVHGRYGQPCPACGDPVQRIVYAQNETNYCARCQTEGRLLADRALSRLLKGDWPRSLEAMEEMVGNLREGAEPPSTPPAPGSSRGS